MSEKNLAEVALQLSLDNHGRFRRPVSAFTCPHCSSVAQMTWGKPSSLMIPLGDGGCSSRPITEAIFVFAHCTACGRECLFVDDRLIYPHSVQAPRAHSDLPSELAADFEEARQIASRSPRGAAALLRLVLQKLCPIIGAKEGPIDKMIGQLVRDDIVPATVQRAMDSVRIWGNEAVHPGELSLHDDPAMVSRLFGLVNFIVEKAITEPRQIDEIFGNLPAGKLAGIERRDGKEHA